MGKALVSIVGASILLFGCGAGCHEFIKAWDQFDSDMAEHRKTNHVSSPTDTYTTEENTNSFRLLSTKTMTNSYCVPLSQDIKTSLYLQFPEAPSIQKQTINLYAP